MEQEPDHRRKSRLAPFGQGHRGLSRSELKDVEQRLRLRSRLIYEIVRQEGEEDLVRSFNALWWSGVAAGLSIGFSAIVEALLSAHLPDAPWRPLVDNFGYCVGFLIVALGRQQLFPESTITAALPTAAEPTRDSLLNPARLWGIVFLANMVGTFLMAAALVHMDIFSPATSAALRDLSLHMMSPSPAGMFFRGIIAGWLVAAMVWLIPSAEAARLWVVILITYLIALGDFTHIVAGAVEANLLVLLGDITAGEMVVHFLLPTLAGNIAGGTALFALISYAQVREEL